MSNDDPRFAAAVAAIDAANAADPNTLDYRGEKRPKELLHAELMTAWVQRLDPQASDAQLLAARANHLRRWSIPREDFPDGRAGYLRWRRRLKDQHATEVAAILAECGYEPGVTARVQQIVRKDGLGRDPQVQTHEDALCLVFLETQFAALADQLGDDRTVTVVRKTLAKMSAAGIEQALALPMSDTELDLVTRATTDT